MPAISTFTGVGNLPTVVQADSLGDGTRLRVNFSEAMQNNSALVLPSSYVVTALLTEVAFQATEVVPNLVTNPTSVELTLAGPLEVGVDNFSVTVSTSLADTVGNTVDPSNRTVTFSGVGPAGGGISITPTPLEVYMVEPMWVADAQTPRLATLRRVLSEVTGSNGRQELVYALLSPYSNFILDAHPDITFFSYGNIGSRTRLATAVAASVPLKTTAIQMFSEAKYLGVSTSIADWLREAYTDLPEMSDTNRLQIMVSLLVLAAVATI